MTEKMEVQENMIILSEIDKIEVKGKGLIYVKDVTVGDIVIMTDGAEQCEFRIISTEFIEDRLAYRLEFEQIFN